ncbi:PAS domain-containing protein [Kineococcus sp. TBRC 1896]|uniref:PAS domain-containing protein n=1 Tax=Kineococcus mangrovi TaxID=1660183 RepID=A0ABV4HXJ9_9ACTN
MDRGRRLPARRSRRLRGRRAGAVGAGGVGAFDGDLSTGNLTWDEDLLELSGYAADDRARVGRALRESIDRVGPCEAEDRVVRPDGTTRWFRARGQTLAGESGRAVRVLGAAHDATAVRDEDARTAHVLSGLDAAVQGLDVGTTATAVEARLELVGDRTRVRWSSAGHLDPLVVTPDGEVRAVDPGAPELLLGIDPATARTDHVAVLGRPAPGEHEDDVALLAFRLHPRDGDRPTDAGPERVPPGLPPVR